MANELQGKRIAFLVASEGVEQVELSEPWKAVKNAGGTPELLSLSPARSKPSTTSTEGISFSWTGGLRGQRLRLRRTGAAWGVANPDFLRTDENAVRFAREFFEQGKPVGLMTVRSKRALRRKHRTG